MLLSVTLYAILLPKKGLVIPFEQPSGVNSLLTFSFGWSFWLVLGTGAIAVLVGAIITIIDTLYPNKFSTILEIDYDTPYRYFVGNDAHVFGHMAADRGMEQQKERPPTPPPRDFGKEAQTFGRASIRKQVAARYSNLASDSSFVGMTAGSSKSISINNPIVNEIRVEEVISSTSNDHGDPRDDGGGGEFNPGFEGDSRTKTGSSTTDECSLPSTSTKEVTLELPWNMWIRDQNPNPVPL